MRRASGPQPGSAFYIRKQTSNKNKSPNVIKAKSRGKAIYESGSSHVIARKNNSFSKAQQNQSSTFFTTQNNKTKKSFPENKKQKDLKKYEKQIMLVLHTSAAIIQRQWRKYLIRKYRKLSLMEKPKVQKIQPIQQPEFDSISGKTSQCSELYNNKKYYSSQVSENKKINENSFNKNVFSFNLSESKAKAAQSPERCSVKPQEISFVKSVVDLKHNRTRSDQTLSNVGNIRIIEKQEQKVLEIAPKIIDIFIEGKNEAHTKNERIDSSKSIQGQTKYEDHFIKTEKNSLEQILRKLQSKLQQKKLKKLLALENSFSNNLLTFRSYKKNIESVAQEHDRKLTILENKKKHLLAKLNEFVVLCEKNIQELKFDEQAKSETGEPKSIQKINLNENHHLDISFNEEMSALNSRSMMLEDWDFDGQFSDKKIKNKLEPVVSDRKNEQILIQDAQREVTIIDGLTQNELNTENSRDQDYKQTKIEPKQIIFNTPPKQIEQKIEAGISGPKFDSELQKSNKTQVANSKAEIVQKKHQIVEQEKDVRDSRKKKLRSQVEVQQQLKKFHPIRPNIDIVNNWLLEISHFILDNFGQEFTRRLIEVDQPNPMQLMKHCATGEPFHREYASISLKIFKQFQFFHIKTLLTDHKVDTEKKETYSALMYTFHQALYDCLNRMLLDELIEGRNWVNYPWSREFKVKKLIVSSDHSKQCLEKAINRVSNISDYNIMADVSEMGRDFDQTQHNLIFAEQIKEIPLTCEIQRGFLMYSLAQMIQKQVVEQETTVLRRIFSP